MRASQSSGEQTSRDAFGDVPKPEPKKTGKASYCRVNPRELGPANRFRVAAELKSSSGLLICTGCRSCWECRLESPQKDLGVLLPRT